MRFSRWLFTLLALSLAFPGPVLGAKKSAIVTSHPLATAAGARVLESGGSAADAAIAAAFALSVVQPSHSGLGGGGLAIYYDKGQNQFSEFDYMAALSLDDVMGAMLPPPEGVKPLKTGVPGFVAGLEKLHQRFGKRAWNELFTDAIALARQGFEVDESMAAFIARLPEETAADADFKSVFGAALSAKKAVLKQENLALTLEKIRDGGAKEFYQGGLARLLTKELAAKGGTVKAGDLEYYAVRIGKPQEFFFKDLRLFVPGRPGYAGPILDWLLRGYRVAKVQTEGPGFAKFLEEEAEKALTDKPVLAQGAPLKTGYAAFVTAVDAEGNAVSMVNTLHGLFGSGTVLPGSGILMNAVQSDPLMKDILSEDEAMADYTLKKRAAHFLLPLMVVRGFDETLALSVTGGFAAPLSAFQFLVKTASENVAYAKALKAPKAYALPQAKQNLYEKGYPAKALEPKPKNPTDVSPFAIAEAGLVLIQRDEVKALSDGRGQSAARAVTEKKK